ncbi:MAG: hypothetical protein E7092_02675 [Bacteroidales bacterium]|nr:hypothetical protein [Bacteroidales bacterium]
MKRTIIALLTLLPTLLPAQESIRLYDEMCDNLQAVFCDHLEEAEVKYIAGSAGQYTGHLIDNTIYGWGHYLADNGSQCFGQYSRGKFMFGIIMESRTAKVGSETSYVEYDLTTGKAIRVHTIEGDAEYTAEQLQPYTFQKITYKNGDAYYGEVRNGRRHGYGIYYWTNGDFWYGKYREGYRQGYGALFKVDRKIFYGKWFGDKKTE